MHLGADDNLLGGILQACVCSVASESEATYPASGGFDQLEPP